MSVRERLREITELPALPEVLLKVQALVNSDEGDAAGLAQIIKSDPALTAKILKVANSAFFGMADRRISSVETAVARIGFNEVRNIAMAVSLVREFSRRLRWLDARQFWRHSVAAAYLVEETAGDQAQTGFIAGLLHDVGLLVYDQFFREEFKSIVEHAARSGCSLPEAEIAVVGEGEGHAPVGAELLAQWRIDPTVVAAVAEHHTPARITEAGGGIGIALASVEAAMGCCDGLSLERRAAPCSPELLRDLRWRAEDWDPFVARAGAMAARAELVLS